MKEQSLKSYIEQSDQNPEITNYFRYGSGIYVSDQKQFLGMMRYNDGGAIHTKSQQNKLILSFESLEAQYTDDEQITIAAAQTMAIAMKALLGLNIIVSSMGPSKLILNSLKDEDFKDFKYLSSGYYGPRDLGIEQWEESLNKILKR